MLAVTSCIEDSVSTSASDQPQFSLDTLDLGCFFSDQPTPTFKFVVYNRNKKVINIDRIGLRDNDDRTFRINVDGTAGESFSNIEIRPNDSIYVFVEATVARGNGRDSINAQCYVDFMTSGVTRSVVLKATGRDIDVRRGLIVERDTTFRAGRPMQVFDSLVVAQGATLTIEPGAELFFHDKATMIVRGRLMSLGSAEAPVVMGGDRLDNVVGDIPFDLMASQWGGVEFKRTSAGSRLSHTVIKNMTVGVLADSVPAAPDGSPGLEIINCRVRNSARYALNSYFSNIRIIGSEISDAAVAPLFLTGGQIDMAHVTVANYYLFAAPALPSVWMNHYNEDTRVEDSSEPLMTAKMANCIFYGLGSDFSGTDLTGSAVTVRRCLFKSEGSDDDNFLECLWGLDPLYLTVREEYIFDYRLAPDSPAAEAGDPSLTPTDAARDFYGVARSTAAPSLGAFQFVAPAPEED